MASFIYFYSKFTEEFLLLSAAGIFTLASVYSYHWVVKRRLLGAARNQVPAGVVKAYLNQLINEAQFVRTQLFGLIAAGEKVPNLAQFQMFSNGAEGTTGAHAGNSAPGAHAAPAVPSDLAERLKALEAQLSEKESMVVNVNVEKTKLHEELENLKRNQKAVQVAAASAGSEDLSQKIKMLEERLEEYSLFEDDLANLKRLQQENTQLKKRLEDSASNTAPAVSAAPTPAPAAKAAPAPTPEPEIEAAVAAPAPEKASLLDQSAIDALLSGESPSPIQEAAPAPVSEAEVASLLNMSAPTPQTNETPEPAIFETAAPKLKLAPEAVAPAPETTSTPQVMETAPTPAPVATVPVTAAAPASAPDDFEKLVDSVETSLDQPAAMKASATPAAAPAENPKEESMLSKTDEELLKEFENLLNS